MVKSVWAGTTTALSLAAWCAVAVAAVQHQAAAAHSRQLHYKFPDHQDGRHLGTSSSSSDDGRRTFFEIREHCTVINTGEDRHGRTHFIINCHNGINDDDAVYHADDYYSDDADSLGDDDYWGDDDYSGDDDGGDDDGSSNGGGWMPSKDDDQNELDDDEDSENEKADAKPEKIGSNKNGPKPKATKSWLDDDSDDDDSILGL